MALSTEQIKELREKTGVSVAECKKALEQAGGDMHKAMEILSVRAVVAAGKKGDRALGAGTIASYIHNKGAVGALVRLSCETDFVSKNEEFTALARDIAMHVSAMRPTSTEELLAQSYIKDPSKTVGDLVNAAVHKFGERVVVSELACFAVV